MTLLALSVEGRGLVDPDEPVVHADDEGFLRGRGAFETVRSYAGRPFRLDAHLERLGRSASSLGLPLPSRGMLEGLVDDVLAATGAVDAALRIYVTPGREGRGRGLTLAMAAALPADLEEQRGRGLALVPIRLGLGGPGLLGGVKSTSYALNMVAQDEARRLGADDAVFLGAEEIVLEAPTANVWWRRGDTLFTPDTETGVLPGVTRAVLLSLAPGLGYTAEEGAYPLAELLAADEVFTSSSVREVMPVTRVDSTSFAADGAAARLQQALRAVATS